jgi:hypothetical protein
MRHDGLKVGLRCALLLTLLLTQGAPPALAVRAGRGGVTEEEAREARETAAAFTDRLVETHDFAPAVRELFVGDFMQRYLRRESDWTARVKTTTFMIQGVPALYFSSSLAARADSEYWPRLYVAAQTFLHFALLSLFSRKSLKQGLGGPDDPDLKDMMDVYPPEAVRVLDGNPTLANFLRMKGRAVEVATADDLREVTTTLEEAVRLTRAHLDERLAKGTRLAQNLRTMKEAAARMQVELLPTGAEFGYPEGTRLFKVFAAIGYELVLVKNGGRMKVVWTTLPSD